MSDHASGRNEPPAFQEIWTFNPMFSYFMFVRVFSPMLFLFWGPICFLCFS